MRVLMLPLCLAGTILAFPALGQECERSDETQSGMNICADVDYRASDARLNKAYGEIIKRLSDIAEGRKLLQASQRAWIAFRDAECAFSTSNSRDGSIYPMLMLECLQGSTDLRFEQLGAYLQCEEGDMSCPVPAQ